MGMVGTTNGSALGAGAVERRYDRRLVTDPKLDDIPYGCWAEKAPKSELWDIVTSSSRE